MGVQTGRNIYSPRDIDLYVLEADTELIRSIGEHLASYNMRNSLGIKVNRMGSLYEKTLDTISDPQDAGLTNVIKVVEHNKSIIPIDIIFYNPEKTITEIVSSFDLGSSMMFMRLIDYIEILEKALPWPDITADDPNDRTRKIYVADQKEIAKVALNNNSDNFISVMGQILDDTNWMLRKDYPQDPHRSKRCPTTAIVNVYSPYNTYYRLIKLWKHVGAGFLHPTGDQVNVLATQILFDDNIEQNIQKNSRKDLYLINSKTRLSVSTWEEDEQNFS